MGGRDRLGREYEEEDSEVIKHLTKRLYELTLMVQKQLSERYCTRFKKSGHDTEQYYKGHPYYDPDHYKVCGYGETSGRKEQGCLKKKKDERKRHGATCKADSNATTP